MLTSNLLIYKTAVGDRVICDAWWPGCFIAAALSSSGINGRRPKEWTPTASIDEWLSVSSGSPSHDQSIDE